jgi:uncharacterized protein
LYFEFWVSRQPSYICSVDKIKLDIVDLSPSQLRSGSFTLLLSEVKGGRKLPIVIGMFEAQAIAMELEKVVPARPLTHDLFKTLAQGFDFVVEEILITDISEGIFYASIVCTDGIRSVSIDARPSDAVAIAVRFDAPIFTYENVLSTTGLSSEDLDEDAVEIENSEIESTGLSSYVQPSLDDLKKELDKALKKEDYETAARLRDEIDKRR